MERKAPEKVTETAAVPTFRAVDLAKREGMLPELLPGSKLRPTTENPKAWLYSAAKLRFVFGDEDLVTESEFNARIAAVSTVLVR